MPLSSSPWVLFAPVLLVLLLSTSPEPSSAHIFQLTITEGDRQVIHLKSFGFVGGNRSNCTLIIKDFKYLLRHSSTMQWMPAKDIPSNPIGFVFEGRDTVNSARLEENVRYPDGQCFVYWKRNDRLSVAWESEHRIPKEERLTEVLINPLVSLNTPQVVDFSSFVQPGFLSLFFYNCNEKSRYSFTIEVHEYNLNPDNTKNYLSVGKSSLPVVYAAFGVLYSTFVLGFFRLMTKHHNADKTKNRVHKIHYLMLVLVFLKAASLLLEGLHLYVIKQYGHGRLYADIPYYTTLSLKGMLLFIVILLVGTGWSFIKPFLTENERKIMFIVIPLVMVDSIAIVVEDTVNEGQAAWATWRDIRRILDVIACCAVLLPVVWSIRNLREATAADGKAARSLVRLRQFRTFYALLVAYIYYTRIVVPLIRSALHWQSTWIAPVIEELGTLVFYFCTGWKFRPQEEDVYTALQNEDFDDISLRAELEAHEMEQQSSQAPLASAGGVSADMEAKVSRKPGAADAPKPTKDKAEKV